LLQAQLSTDVEWENAEQSVLARKKVSASSTDGKGGDTRRRERLASISENTTKGMSN